MKMLHALAGYLAATVLLYHQFAFASPLAAIDYDGYVNTSYTTTQNHGDDALMKRVPGDIIEARQAVLFVVPAVVFIIVGEAILTVLYIGQDDPVRGSDVEFLVEHFGY